jgi:hypothetical protein
MWKFPNFPVAGRCGAPVHRNPADRQELFRFWVSTGCCSRPIGSKLDPDQLSRARPSGIGGKRSEKSDIFVGHSLTWPDFERRNRAGTPMAAERRLLHARSITTAPWLNRHG